MADNLSHYIFGAHIIGFRTGLFWNQSLASTLRECIEDLEKALFAVAIFLNRFAWTQSQTLAFKEHGQLPGELVLKFDGQATDWLLDEQCFNTR